MAPGFYGLPNFYSNSWQYDMSPARPNDLMGALNDINLFRFNADTQRYFNSAIQLNNTLTPMIDNYYAQLAEQWQKMIGNISSNNNSTITINNNVTNTNKNLTADGKIVESKVIDTLRKMGSGEAVADRINQEITIKDKDGNERKITILNRLIELCEAYRKDPENAELSREDYETIRAILGRYEKDGDISSDDFATLKKIAEKTKAADDDDDDDDNDDTTTPNNDAPRLTDMKKAKETNESYKTTVKNAADEFASALYGRGTDYTHLNNALGLINKDNIVEIFDKFYMAHGINEGETLIDAITADFDNWNNTWYGATGCAGTFAQLKDALVKRAEDHIENYGDTEDKKLKQAIDKFNTEFASINNDNYSSSKGKLKQMFNDIINAIKEAEATVIAKEKEEANNNDNNDD